MTERWFPTPDFFAANPRAQEIRGICKTIAYNVNQIAFNDRLTPGEITKRRQTLTEQLDKISALGITKGMHAGISPAEVMQRDPVIIAEWVAGGTLDYFDVYRISEAKTARMVMGEFATVEGETLIVDARSHSVQDFERTTRLMILLSEKLALTRQEFEDEAAK